MSLSYWNGDLEARDFSRVRLHILTLAPIDLETIDVNWLNEQGRQALNRYHARVYETISPYLCDEDKAWLLEATRAV